MAENSQFKRNIAYKLRIGELLLGKPIFDSQTHKFTHLELGNKKVVRINLIGNLVDKYENSGEKQYIFFTLDDGSGQIKLKSFGDDAQKFKNLGLGQTIAVIGLLRNFNNETYVSPEIIQEKDPRYLLIRKLEIEKQNSLGNPTIETKKQIIAIKDEILEQIKKAEISGGIDIDTIIMKLSQTSPEMINSEIKKLIEEGIVFEPRPGKLRYLG